jgi:hypothetical protein
VPTVSLLPLLHWTPVSSGGGSAGGGGGWLLVLDVGLLVDVGLLLDVVGDGGCVRCWLLVCS